MTIKEITEKMDEIHNESCKKGLDLTKTDILLIMLIDKINGLERGWV